VDGVLIGTNLSLLDMCKNMKKWLNLKIEDVLQMVTYNPSKLLGEKIGMIEKGFFANFVILDQELNLKKVFINGEQVK
jgi:N-acetylglucosamine-6-phosphate deacetylase